jgi:signal transduction histidine kinase
LAEEVKEIARELIAKSEAHEELAEIVDAADTILLCVSHQNTLVDDILSFSKLDSMMLSLVPREVRPKWEFAKALKVFHSEFKAKEIKFHYAMDITYQETEVDYVVADINRMKQGECSIQPLLFIYLLASTGKSHHQCYQIHRKEGRRKKY